MFAGIQPPSVDEVYKLICSMPPKSSPMDQNTHVRHQDVHGHVRSFDI